jgi:hypothetical protein
LLALRLDLNRQLNLSDDLRHADQFIVGHLREEGQVDGLIKHARSVGTIIASAPLDQRKTPAHRCIESSLSQRLEGTHRI